VNKRREKILITGGAGFVGYHLARYLACEKKYEIDIVDNCSRGAFDDDLKRLIRENSVRFFRTDLTVPGFSRRLAGDYTYIYHLSGVVGVRNVLREPDKVLYVNTVATLRLLEWIKRCQKKLRRFVFTSTSEIYAGTAKHCGLSVPTGENIALCLDDIAAPRTTYALSKMVGESACFNYSRRYRIPFTIVRYHNVYGPRMGYDHVIPELMMRSRNERTRLGVYSTRHTRAFCYITDAVSATVKLAESKKGAGEIFNVGNAREEIPIGKLAQQIIRIVNPSLTVKPLGAYRASPIRRCPDINKLKETVGFTPRVPLERGLRLTWEWYKDRKCSKRKTTCV